MWWFMTRRMRRGSALGSARLPYSTRALKTAVLAIWPEIRRVSVSAAPR